MRKALVKRAIDIECDTRVQMSMFFGFPLLFPLFLKKNNILGVILGTYSSRRVDNNYCSAGL